MPSPDRKSTTPARIAVREKEALAVELRAAGLPYKEIEEQCGWTPGGGAACRAVKRYLDEMGKEPAEHLIRVEVMRLDKLLSYLWPAAQRGKWLAVDRILKVMERKSALLGLDAPQKRIVEHITPEAFHEALAVLEAENAELSAKLEKAGSSIDVDLDRMDREVALELEQVAGATTEDEILEAEVVG